MMKGQEHDMPSALFRLIDLVLRQKLASATSACRFARSVAHYIAIALVLMPVRVLLAQEPAASDGQSTQTYSPTIAPASNEGLLAIKRMQVPAGLSVELVAAEPM